MSTKDVHKGSLFGEVVLSLMHMLHCHLYKRSNLYADWILMIIELHASLSPHTINHSVFSILLCFEIFIS